MLYYLFKIVCSVLAQRTDEILGQGIALIYISAYTADIALLVVCLRLGLDVVLVVGVSHGLTVGKDT